jgi:hypothetical protein
MIDIHKIEDGIARTFDDDDPTPLVQKVRPTEIWLDMQELEDNGFTLEQVSRWLLGLTQADTFKNQNLPEPGHEDDAVFAAALPTAGVDDLPCLAPLISADA